MNWLHDLSYFVGGAALINSVPHLVSGATGRSFQTPFAKPPGRGLSSPVVNMLWGCFNLALAYLLVLHVGNFDAAATAATDHVVAMALGIVLMGVGLAYYFGALHGGNAPT